MSENFSLFSFSSDRRYLFFRTSSPLRLRYAYERIDWSPLITANSSIPYQDSQYFIHIAV